MKIERKFTKAGQDAYAELEFVTTSSEIRNPDGSTVFKLDGVEVPAGWSQVASDVIAQKYFRKAGVPAKLKRVKEKGVPEFLWRSVPDGKDVATGGEISAKQVFDRLAGAWAYWGWKGGYFTTESDAQAYFDEMRVMLARQMAAPNSPQWFNTGLHWAYGIDGPGQGHFYVDYQTGELTKSTSAYEHPQPHACFIQSVADDLVGDGGIMDLWVREARLFKYGSGTGTNFSSLRAAGESLSGGGKSSGLMGFLKIGDRAAGAIKSGGTTRRAAKMVICDADHPDIQEFINWKVKEEQKVASIVAGSKMHEEKLNEIFAAIRAWDGSSEDSVDPKKNEQLKTAIRSAKKTAIPETYVKRVLDYAKQGYDSIEFPTYDTDWDSEAYASVSGQNSNNSIRVTDAFLKAVKDDGDWALINRTDGSIAKTIKARDLWEDVGHAAWACADPGIQYHDTVNAWHTCPEDGEIRGSNPCSEYMFLDDTACNLASMNLLKFYDDGRFDAEAYMHASRLWTVTLEISVMMAQFPSKEIAQRSFDFRTLGLGYANIGGLLMNMGLGYDSDEGRALCGALTAIMTGVSYATSAEMAGELGAFSGYERNKDHMLRVMRNHRNAAYGATEGYEDLAVKPVPLDLTNCPDSRLVELAMSSWDEALRLGEMHGYRNAQSTVIAPTGTIGLVMDCDTTGIEPDIALVKYKKLVGGGQLKIINNTVPEALERLGYTGDEVKSILAYIEENDTIEGAPGLREEHVSIFDCAFVPLNGQRSIHYMGHIRMMAAAQPFLSGAISKTVNMPHEATVEEISEAYIEAWKLGLKAVAVYRDGSKRTQPLNTDDGHENEKAAAPTPQEARQAPPSPQRVRLPDERQAITHKFSIGGHEGYLTVGLYPNGQPGEMFIAMAKEGSVVSGLMDSFATACSIMLQYGVPMNVLIKKFSHSRFEPSGFTTNPELPMAKSIMDYIFRWMDMKFGKGPKRPKAEDFSTGLETGLVEGPILQSDSEEPRITLGRSESEKVAFRGQTDAPPCTECGEIMVRNGACYKCLNCAATSGCS
jgi:ribonucleoside-diphosphate reductase alpha chain